MFYAHSTADSSRADWELLPDHLNRVADLASRYGDTLGLGNICRVAGLFHDIGKYSDAFQSRLSGASGKVDHSTAGAALVGMLADPRDAVFAELVAYAIAGHHAGLPDKSGVTGGSLAERIAAFDEDSLDPAWKGAVGAELGPLRPTLDWRKDSLGFQLAVLGRMVFSALVDADFKATEAFYAGEHGPRPDRTWPTLAESVGHMTGRLEARLEQLAGRGGQVADLRGEILRHVRAAAARDPGLYTLTVTTGGGKTLTSLAFALDHARAHGSRRIIYAIPFTAVVDQTAGQFRELFGDDIVLEHHSAMESQAAGDARRGDSGFAGRDKLRLAMEDWSAPLVVTTSVQLFESLFASRTSAARKLHNIANSIIVLDEAQTLPRPLLLPILRVLEALALDYRCTIVLCTATQPALDRRHLVGGLALEGRELAPDPANLAEQLRRVTLRQGGVLSDADLVDQLRGRHRPW